jgi:hypothetical protein
MSVQRTSRWRPVAKWVGLAFCLLIVAGWGLSVPYGRAVSIGDRGYVGLFSDAVIVGVLDKSSKISSQMRIHCWTVLAIPLPGFESTKGVGRLVGMPWWILLLVIGYPTAAAFYRDRRGKIPGYCKSCGYDLTGNVSGVCPECGTRTTA